jgi:MbtH protein
MFNDDHSEYLVVVNQEAQYSIWPADRELPAGWHAVGPPGPRQECLAVIDKAWTDMRPLSLRTAMDARSAGARSASRHPTEA